MDGLGVAASIISVFQLYFQVLGYVSGSQRIYRLLRLYGLSGLALFFFGSWSVWSLEAQVLARLDDGSVKNFKKTVLDESTMISVSAAIIAQIAITGFSLDFLSQTHWVAQAFLIFSLTASLMAVYYASTQQRTLGRLLEAEQVRTWIRGYVHRSSRRIPIYDPPTRDSFLSQTQAELLFKFQTSQCWFRPSVASVLTISAPQVLLSASLISLLTALGIYLGFTWTKSLDIYASDNDSRNVFIFYIIGLFVCFLVYSLSSLAQDVDGLSEDKIVQDNLREWWRLHRQWVEQNREWLEQNVKGWRDDYYQAV